MIVYVHLFPPSRHLQAAEDSTDFHCSGVKSRFFGLFDEATDTDGEDSTD